ncbi:MAG: PepSY domain-containing protein [Aquimonas sp.]|nr:PepSY domain-containing protein [Aquimonas sp.]
MPSRLTNHHWRALLLPLFAALLACGSGASSASDDHERARQALEAGAVLPLRTILERVEREYPGQVIDVELERGQEKNLELWIYKVKVLRPGGSLVKLKVDARDGTIIGRKAKGDLDGERARQKPHGSGEGR